MQNAVKQVDNTVLGLYQTKASGSPYIAFMGVYMFKTDVLLKLLKSRCPTSNDFGSEIISSSVRDHNVQVRVKFLTTLQVLPGPSPPATPSFTNCVALTTTLIRFLTIVRNTINTTTFTRAS
ncbi:hypothetical protein MKW98_010024 [Papaver atlanticum]|uniref:glucose-1-phosphate adenylyltransferase n=1 Tax=Papaver atlanticum TaxID=357466 RepID=A0AAD4RXC3_9MAGN|nr:hypothetical protein MKW98_010024 [Papaver atlanticum]